MTAPLISDLAMLGKLAAASRNDVARAGVGMAMHPHGDQARHQLARHAEGRADHRPVDHLRRAGRHGVDPAIDLREARPDRADEREDESSRDSAAHAVAEKKAELGFTQISEILNVPGATFAAPAAARGAGLHDVRGGDERGHGVSRGGARFIEFISGRRRPR